MESINKPQKISRQKSRFWLMSGLLLLPILLSGCSGTPVEHAPAENVNAGDTAFMLISAALVMLMTPALALFYGGLVRTKNVLSVVMHSFIALGVCTVVWFGLGYSLAFAPSAISIAGADGKAFGLIGDLSFAGLGNRNVGLQPHPIYCATVPHRLFMVFQCMFAIITPALISGAFAERMKFKTYLVFITLWLLLVYCPVCHWVWSASELSDSGATLKGGWLRIRGSLDFAGGTVVHMTSGWTALLVALMIGPRKGFPREAFLPHNLVFTVLGAGLLWFGWFGFNAGSALGSSTVAVSAFIATHCAAAAGAVAWVFVDWILKDKPTLLGAASGAVAGLVAVTPASGFVGPNAAMIIGGLAGVICSWVVTWRARKGIDDALDAFGIHGVGGLLGAILTGVFASTAINAAGANGLIKGNAALMLEQIIACMATLVYSLVVSYILLKVLDLTMGLRVTSEEEQMGLDLTQHGESAYSS